MFGVHVDATQIHRPLDQGRGSKGDIDIFFSWEEDPIVQSVSAVAAPGDKVRYEAISARNCCSNIHKARLIPRSTYRKAIGEGP